MLPSDTFDYLVEVSGSELFEKDAVHPWILFNSTPFFFRYVYKFVCDLQSLLGYSPEELQAMVAQQQQQQQQQQQSAAASVSSLDPLESNASTPPLHSQPPLPLKREALD